jgi:SAM-dependent methyltransferase
MTKWIHPTGNNPKTVNLVCLGPSRNAFIAANFEMDSSEIILHCDETWTLNRGVKAFPHDLLFVMDHIQGEADKNPRYGALLWKHDKPIITSDNCEGWPAHVVKYPFKEIWNWTINAVNPMHGDWYHNSVAYIIVYAAFIGVKDLRVYGADYSGHNNGGYVEDGHPCVAYWVGKMEALGLTVTAPTDSGFLNINMRKWLYGYQNDPRKIPANRARFRAMVGGKPDPDSTALLSGERQVAPSLEHIQPDHVYRYQWAASKFLNDRVLDIGSGIGYGSALLRDSGAYSVSGFELSQESIDYAKTHYARDGIEWTQCDLDGEIIHDKADSAVAFEIIEHLHNPKPLLKNLKAKRLFASVPNEAVIPYSPEFAPFHQRHYTKDEFNSLLNECGWKVIEWCGQIDPKSPVIGLTDQARTLVVEAVRMV